MAATDWDALEVVGTCRAARLKVPQDVAVLGVDNDEVFCIASHPPLSSVETPSEAVGFQAAKLFDGLLRGGRVPKKPVLLPPAGVTARQSTDISLVTDPDLADALRFIGKNYAKRISVDDVLHVVPISRRTLELKFRRLLHSSVLEEITRLRAEEAMRLLRTTDLPLAAVAHKAGFSGPAHLSKVMRRQTRLAPMQLRQALQGVASR